MAGHIQSSDNINWCSPHWCREGALYVFDGHIDLDPASNDFSVMGAEVQYKLPEHDGLMDPWNVKGDKTTVWDNPPFGRCYMKPDRSDIIGAKAFQALKKADERNGTHLADEYLIHTSIENWFTRHANEYKHNGVQSLLLVPYSADTGSWQDIAYKTATSRLAIRGRVRFLMPDGKPGGPCPMACAIAYWGDHPERFEQAFKDKGDVYHMWKKRTA